MRENAIEKYLHDRVKELGGDHRRVAWMGRNNAPDDLLLLPGEHWRMAMDITIAAVGDRGLIVIPQEAWEGLDTANRGAIHSQAQSAGVTVLTAECSDDETVTPAQYEITT
jgi:hypothetical protein